MAGIHSVSVWVPGAVLYRGLYVVVTMTTAGSCVGDEALGIDTVGTDDDGVIVGAAVDPDKVFMVGTVSAAVATGSAPDESVDVCIIVVYGMALGVSEIERTG